MRRTPIKPLVIALTAGLALALGSACEPGSGAGSGRDATSHPGGKGPGKDDRRPATIQGIPTATGTHKLKLDVGTPGHREYLLHVPPAVTKGRFRDGRPARRLPLVLAMHGGLSEMHAMERLTGFSPLADRKGFLVAYPDGFMTTWNAGGCCGAAKLANTDDVGFLTKLIDKLVSAGLADPDRIYATGFSNGAGMALRLACEGPGRIAAVGSVSGSQIGDCSPDRPISVMIMHGTADPGVPFNGGGHRDWNDKRPFPPVTQVVDFWRKEGRLPALRRTGEATTLAARLDRTAEGDREPGHGDARCEATGTGGQGVEVAFCRIEGGGHHWPGVAASVLWDFFAAHPRK